MRSLSSVARLDLYAQEADYVLPILLALTHGVSGYANPLRIVNNSVDLVYNGDTYTAFPFQFEPPAIRQDGTITPAKLSICAVDQQISAILLSTTITPVMNAIAAFWKDTGVFEQIALFPLSLKGATNVEDVIEAEFVFETRLDNVVPLDIFRPSTFPSMF